LATGGLIYPEPEPRKYSNLKVIFPASSNLLYRSEDWKKAIWLSIAEAYSQTLTFATSALSDAGDDDEQFAPADLFPPEIPETITEAEVLGIIVEINKVTNNCNKAISESVLRVSVHESNPTDLTDVCRGRTIEWSGDAVNGDDLVGDIVTYIPLVDSIPVKRSKDDLWVRVTDILTKLASATGSSLTAIITGNHYAILGVGVTPLEAEAILKEG
jgi:hypothetical protein